ncbi:MAG: potassium-transporting ATPase subunit KdpA [Gammaproteobacteria bacterium]|nr:potassium-transporting ATPase subunit KdpA [Gammaproteobacteria bacterium]
MAPATAFQCLLALLLGLVLLSMWPLGVWIAETIEGRPRVAAAIGGRIERALYRWAGIDPAHDMPWSEYAFALLLFNAGGALVLYGLQRLQGHLPLNPQRFGAVSGDSALNTAVSFVTNTNWQGYPGESTMGYLVQMAGFAVQNFLSAATGLAVAVALARGLARHGAQAIGNFWTDVVRSTLYLLLPLSVVIALLMVAGGVIQNFSHYLAASPLQPLAGHAQQLIPMGPVASQEAIKELGTNGGGFFNANSAHPFENPSALTNLLQLWAILAIPFALTCTFGRIVGDARQGWALAATMAVLLVVLAQVAYFNEHAGNPLLGGGVDQAADALQPGGNMEGKEARFGIAASALYAAVTTATSCGAVNAMHDSFTPLGGLAPLFLMQLGELAPGGVGTGLYSILVFAILGVFIAGLMIGRTPEYLGKKIEAAEMKLASIFILVTPFLVLLGTAVSVAVPAGRAGVANPGAHGFTEILYAWSSVANNNGSAFGGLAANTPFYNYGTAIAMWLGRFWPIVCALAIASSLAAKKRLPVTGGTMPTHGPLFVALLLGSILLLGVLTYVPALALGPVAEHLLLHVAR